MDRRPDWVTIRADPIDPPLPDLLRMKHRDAAVSTTGWYVRRRSLLLGMTSGALAALTGCSRSVGLTRVDVIRWIGYEPLIVARTRGWIDEARDGLRLVELPSNTATLMELASGDLEAATLTLDECLMAIDGGLDVRVLWVFDESVGADAVLAQPAIKALADLRGRRIGVEETAAGALMLDILLAEAGLSLFDIVKVPVTSDQHLAAYTAGQVDAVVTFEPFATQLMHLGARRLLDSSRFPGLIVDVLVARAEALKAHGPHLATLARAHFRVLDDLAANPAAVWPILGERLRLTGEEVEAALRGVRLLSLADNQRWLLGPEPTLNAAARRVAAHLRRAGMLSRTPALDHLTGR